MTTTGVDVATILLGQFPAFGIVDVFSVVGTEDGFALGKFRSRALFDNRYVHKHRIFSVATLLQLKSGAKVGIKKDSRVVGSHESNENQMEIKFLDFAIK